MIDAEELARWEKAARKDNPSYWGSDTLVRVFDELRRVEDQKDTAYRERNMCVLAIAHMAHDAGWGVAHRPDENEKGWNLLFIETPSGQISWHFSDRELAGFSPFSVRDTKWDGHSNEEKYRRLLSAVSAWMGP